VVKYSLNEERFSKFRTNQQNYEQNHQQNYQQNYEQNGNISKNISKNISALQNVCVWSCVRFQQD